MDVKRGAENENRCEHSYDEVPCPVTSCGDGHSCTTNIEREYLTGHHPGNRSVCTFKSICYTYFLFAQELSLLVKGLG